MGGRRSVTLTAPRPSTAKDWCQRHRRPCGHRLLSPIWASWSCAQGEKGYFWFCDVLLGYQIQTYIWMFPGAVSLQISRRACRGSTLRLICFRILIQLGWVRNEPSSFIPLEKWSLLLLIFSRKEGDVYIVFHSEKSLFLYIIPFNFLREARQML